MWWGVEDHLGSRLHYAQPEPAQQDTRGRDLYILIVDSLSFDDFDQMTALVKLGGEGFVADVQPCVDNFTSACVREAFTGRPSFSLFSALENFKVIGKGVGENLIGDAREAGLRTAFISHGDLRTWSKQVDEDIRPDEEDHAGELSVGLEAAKNHDLIVHHWIWHDVTTHHARPGDERYQGSLARTNRLIAGLARGLPEEMDLIVTGDHGHAPDGRHVQGMDTPTRIVVRSPNVQPIKMEGRIPIAAIRYLAGGVIGIGSTAAQSAPSWEPWLSPDLGASVRLSSQGVEHVEPGIPWWSVLATTMLSVLAALGFGWQGALAVLAIAAGLGASYPTWLELTQQRLPMGKFHRYLWVVPVFASAVGLLRWRSFPHAYRWTVYGAVALLLGLWPGLGHVGVLKNTDAIWMPVLIGAAALAFLEIFSAQTDARRSMIKRFFYVLIFIVGAAVATEEMTAFSTNDMRIRTYSLRALRHQHAEYIPWVNVALGAALYWSVHRHVLVSLLAAVLVFFGASFPPLVHAALFAGLMGLLVFASDPVRARGVTLLALTVSGYALTTRRQIGALALALTMSLGFAALSRLGRDPRSEVRDRAILWAVALGLVLTAYVGMAWTMGLRIYGIDFSFAVQWLEGRWHKTLWWVVASATVVACFLPLVLVIQTGRTIWGQRFARMADLAARLAALRFVGTVVFAMSWMLVAGSEAASSRLRGSLQDGMAWLIIAVMLGLLSAPALGRRSLSRRRPAA